MSSSEYQHYLQRYWVSCQFKFLWLVLWLCAHVLTDSAWWIIIIYSDSLWGFLHTESGGFFVFPAFHVDFHGIFVQDGAPMSSYGWRGDWDFKIGRQGAVAALTSTQTSDFMKHHVFNMVALRQLMGASKTIIFLENICIVHLHDLAWLCQYTGTRGIYS